MICVGLCQHLTILESQFLQRLSQKVQEIQALLIVSCLLSYKNTKNKNLEPSTSSAGNVHRNSTINQGANDGSERNTRAVTARQSAGRIESAPVEVANPATQSAIVQVLTTGEASQLHEKILESPKDKWYYYLDQTRANQIVEVDTRLPRTEGKCPDQKDKKLDEQARIERNVAGILKNAALEISNR